VVAFKDTQFAGILPLLTSLLLQKGPPRNTKNKDVNDIPKAIHPLIFTAIKVINNIAMLDIVFLQVFFGCDDFQVEWYHLLHYLISYTASGSDNDTKMLNELILLIGYYTLQNDRNQEILQWGNSPTILQRLCALPFQYFSDARHKRILFPTLIAACFMNTRNKSILEQEMSTDLLVAYLHEETASVSIATNSSETKDTPKVPPRFQLANRFPVSLWEQAESFFSNKEPEPTVEEIFQSEMDNSSRELSPLRDEEIQSQTEIELQFQNQTLESKDNEDSSSVENQEQDDFNLKDSQDQKQEESPKDNTPLQEMKEPTD